jgi:hypothetical protein
LLISIVIFRSAADRRAAFGRAPNSDDPLIDVRVANDAAIGEHRYNRKGVVLEGQHVNFVSAIKYIAKLENYMAKVRTHSTVSWIEISV